MSCVCAFALCPPAWAQDSVSVRTSTREDYGRVVFDGAAATPYTVNRVSADTVELEFNKTMAMDTSGINIAATKNIKSVEKISADGENLKVKITIPEDGTFRHFLIGKRLVMDVYGAAEIQTTEVREPVAKPPKATPVPDPVKAAVKKPEETKAEEKKPEIVVAAKPAPKADQPPVPAIPAPAVEEKPAVAEPVAVEPAVTVDPLTITISSTATMGIAAFERNGDVWIVADRADITVPPQVTGGPKDKPPLEPIPLTGGMAWRMPVPDGMKVYGEGGGLVWRIQITPDDRETKPVSPERSFEPGETIRGGTLFWPMQRVTRVIEFLDPFVGDKIQVGTVDQATQFTGGARDFVDFEALASPIGIVVIPKTDDVQVRPVGNGVQVTRPGGLALSRTRDITQKAIAQQVNTPTSEIIPNAAAIAPGSTPMKRIYDFDRWMMGGLNALRENQQILLGGMANKDKTGRVQDLLMMAKMNIANDRGQEAVGLLNFAENEMPDIAESPEFLALRGSAEAMAGKFEIAFKDLSTPSLADYSELGYWRAYTLAGLEDWQQAEEAMPQDFDVLLDYPLHIQERLVLKLAEVSLRAGDVPRTERLLSALEKNRKDLRPWTVSGLDYLLGEKHRQANETAQAAELWKPLAAGKDDLYRAKASLALTMMQLQKQEIKREEAIDRLEGLRYHWRGDELEAQTNFMLGKLYLEDERYLKGFTILRDATVMSPDSDISREIATFMADSFKNLFLTNKVNELTPIDAVTVYEEFRELTPAGAEGNRLVQRLAERLVDADLLGRAAALLQHQVDYRLAGKELADVARRLAAIYLLNDDPGPAIPVLDKATVNYAAIQPQDADIIQKQKEVDMLRARALSDQDDIEGALAVLNKYPPSPEMNSLRADISWNAGMWEDAAEALQDLILDESIDPARPVSQKQADLLLNRAVALNLAGDRVGLANMRTKFGPAMEKTARAKMFDVVTRQRTGNLSSDRESIAALVSEVDMFKDFLDSYRASNQPSN